MFMRTLRNKRDVVFFTQVRDIPIFRINRIKKKIASLVLQMYMVKTLHCL